jgi:hypothetical protein
MFLTGFRRGQAQDLGRHAEAEQATVRKVQAGELLLCFRTVVCFFLNVKKIKMGRKVSNLPEL